MIFADIRPVRAAADTDFSDLTASLLVSAQWVNATDLELTFDVEPTVVEARRIRRRLITPDPAREAAVTEILGLMADLEVAHLAGVPYATNDAAQALLMAVIRAAIPELTDASSTEV